MFRKYEKNRCYIIAEVGGNFSDFSQAMRLVDAASECGVDAVKIQTYRADTVASVKAVFDMENTGVISQHELFKLYEVDEELHCRVFNYIDKKGMDWFSTPSHQTDVDFLDSLGAEVYKIGSDDATNIPLLKYIARKGKPMMLSTGMCTMGEVRESVDAVLGEGNENLILLHAITSYPTHLDDVNLRAMQTMINEFPALDIGYSDHTQGVTACICAAAMGACVVEKHFTYDKQAKGPDHMLSSDPEEMAFIVDSIRSFEKMKGSGIKRPADGERITRVNNRKSIIAIRELRSGDILRSEDLAIKRPGFGIEPRYLDQLIGRTVGKHIEADDVLTWGDLK